MNCMMRIFFYLLIFFVMFSCTAEKTDTLSELKKEINAEFSITRGNFAVAFKNLANAADTLFINAHTTFHAASTMKTPVLLEVYKQAAAGKFDLDDSILVKNSFQSIVDSSKYVLNLHDDSYPDLYNIIGQKETIRNLTHAMIISSSNLATNLIIELVGAPQVTQTLRDMGAHDIQVLRGVEDTKAYEQGLSNTTTAYDLMVLYEYLAEKKIVNPAACDTMIQILLEQEFNEIIPGKLPKEVQVAHKTGWITGLHHDSGIVYLPDGREYVLVLLSADLEDERKGVETLATVSKMIYDYLNKK